MTALLGALKELGTNLLAMAALLLGLMLIKIFFGLAVSETSAVWQAPIAFGLALAATALGLTMVYAAVRATTSQMAEGWLGLLTGRVPPGYARGGDGLRGVMALALLGAACYFGLLLFRKGAREGELNWALEGLFLMAGGLVFGLLPAIPRLYFAGRGAGGTAQQRRDRPGRGSGGDGGKRAGKGVRDGVTLFVTLAVLGVGLGLAAIDITVAARDRGKVVARPAPGVRAPAPAPARGVR
ncbi:MAG: hypothetical protein IT370_25400 [Deltaproteobacteria bacterium]|nr:hypothetical protein [Deltaproteobacteria bacterium]